MKPPEPPKQKIYLTMVRHAPCNEKTKRVESASVEKIREKSKELLKTFEGLGSKVNEPNVKIYSSPVLRAKQTAAILAHAFGLIKRGDDEIIGANEKELDSLLREAKVRVRKNLSEDTYGDETKKLASNAQTLAGKASETRAVKKEGPLHIVFVTHSSTIGDLILELPENIGKIAAEKLYEHPDGIPPLWHVTLKIHPQ